MFNHYHKVHTLYMYIVLGVHKTVDSDYYFEIIWSGDYFSKTQRVSHQKKGDNHTYLWEGSDVSDSISSSPKSV
jgi:hypothetical protein